MQSFAIAKRDAYNLPTRPTCVQAGAVALSPSYQGDPRGRCTAH